MISVLEQGLEQALEKSNLSPIAAAHWQVLLKAMEDKDDGGGGGGGGMGFFFGRNSASYHQPTSGSGGSRDGGGGGGGHGRHGRFHCGSCSSKM
jgi:ABC-type glycerol-3-phosphate transport system substrate-binding protein